MVIDIGEEALYRYIGKQLSSFFPDQTNFYTSDTKESFQKAIIRTENCFKHISLPGFSDDRGQTYLSHTHTDQYAMFLYYLMNSLWCTYKNKLICDKIMCLNRLLHGFFLSYKCELPDIFCFQHPLGSVIGNASYSNYLVIEQNVTINTGISKDGSLSPQIGEGCYLACGSKIIGNEKIGNRCSIGVNAIVYNQSVPDDCNVICGAGGLSEVLPRKNKLCNAQKFFRTII